MIHLDLPKDPHWIDIIPGVRVYVRPINSIIHEAALATAARLTSELLQEQRGAREVGATVENMPDLENPDMQSGVNRVLYKKALARHAIIAWEGIADRKTGEPAPVTEKTVGDFMMLPGLSNIFYDKYWSPLELLTVEKKASGTAPIGTGSQAVVPDTAAAAAVTA